MDKIFESFIHENMYEHDISCQHCRSDDQEDTDDLLILNDEISENEIINAISLMSNNKSPGLDGIVIELIKAAQTFYVPIFQKLFNKMLDTGNFPEAWCKAILCPVHKKGDVEEPKNYRGFSEKVIQLLIRYLICKALFRNI